MKRLAQLLFCGVFLVGVTIFLNPRPVCAAAPACDKPGSNPNKAGIMIDTHHDSYKDAAALVGKGGWVVELAFPDTGEKLQEHLAQFPDVNMVIWGMPGAGTKADADGWCATLGELDTNGKKIYFKPWNTANSTDPKDTYAVKGTPQQVADYQNNLYSCLSKSGLLNNKVILLSPVLITGSNATYPYDQYFDAIADPKAKENVARSLYDVWERGTPCSAGSPKDNACMTDQFAKSVGGKYTYAVEGGVANPQIAYRDDEMANLINKMANPIFPGSWVSEDSFIMGALYAFDPDTYGERWDIWKNGSKTRAAYQKLKANGCVGEIANQAEIDKKFKPWFESVRTLIVDCDVFGYSSKKELCNAPPKPEETKSLDFPPLGTLQACPQEIPVIPSAALPDIPKTGICNIEPIDEPKSCQNPDVWTNGDFFGNGGEAEYCLPNSCKKYGYDDKNGKPFPFGQDGKVTCEHQGFGRFTKSACLGDPDSPWYQSWLAYRDVCIKNSRPATGEDIAKITAPQDRKLIGLCLTYFKELGQIPGLNQSRSDSFQGLPACVPTTYANKAWPKNLQPAQCVSECSQPLDIVQTLSLSTIGNCSQIDGSGCHAQIKIQDKTFTLPFAKNLADYFAGTLDAEQSSQGELEESGKDFQTLLRKAGVAKKLLPEETQDKLKCEFIKGTLKKIATKKNTKYAFEKDGKPDVFKIDGIPITDFASSGFPPYFDPSLEADCSLRAFDKKSLSDWSMGKFGQAWRFVPLFSNDDLQGEIQFVSPSLFSIEPVKVSLPDLNRLNSVTSVLQSLLLPEFRSEFEEKPETFGKTISFKQDNVCRPTPVWENYYSGTDYERAVLCKIKPAPSAGGPDSQVCVLEKNGVINCQRQNPGPAAIKVVIDEEPETKVQVRTIFPALLDIAQQTISPATGLLRIFKPAAEKRLIEGGISLDKQDATDEFERHFDPVPAESEPIKYEVTVSQTLELKQKDDGWKIYFYKLGGLWNARNFVLDLLSPTGSGSANKN